MSAEQARAHKTHTVKCWTEFFGPISDGRKTFDLRIDDRDYQVGDNIIQEEFRHGVGEFTGRECRCEITYIGRGRSFERFGLAPGYAILAIKLV